MREMCCVILETERIVPIKLHKSNRHDVTINEGAACCSAQRRRLTCHSTKMNEPQLFRIRSAICARCITYYAKALEIMEFEWENNMDKMKYNWTDTGHGCCCRRFWCVWNARYSCSCLPVTTTTTTSALMTTLLVCWWWWWWWWCCYESWHVANIGVFSFFIPCCRRTQRTFLILHECLLRLFVCVVISYFFSSTFRQLWHLREKIPIKTPFSRLHQMQAQTEQGALAQCILRRRRWWSDNLRFIALSDVVRRYHLITFQSNWLWVILKFVVVRLLCFFFHQWRGKWIFTCAR